MSDHGLVCFTPTRSYRHHHPLLSISTNITSLSPSCSCFQFRACAVCIGSVSYSWYYSCREPQRRRPGGVGPVRRRCSAASSRSSDWVHILARETPELELLFRLCFPSEFTRQEMRLFYFSPFSTGGLNGCSYACFIR